MKIKQPVLIGAVTLTLVLEILLIILVYNRIGGARLPAQLIRLSFQIVFALLLFSSLSKWGLFLLFAYHTITGLIILLRSNQPGTMEVVFGAYHILFGIIIYLHDWIERRLFKGGQAES